MPSACCPAENRRAAVPVAVQVAGDQPDQVVVALGRLGQQREVVPVAMRRVLARPTVVDEVDLTAQERLDARLARAAVELDRARHGAVVGDPDRGHAELGRTLDELRDTAGAVQDRVLGVDVQMGVAIDGAIRASLLCEGDGAGRSRSC
jgi:hypothetical protein